MIQEMSMQAQSAAAGRKTESALGTRGLSSPLPIYLAFKEFWRNKGRFFLVALVIALITTLVLFIDGLAEGLGSGNIEYLDKLEADLVVFQENTDLSTTTSRIGWSKQREFRRVEGVQEVGLVGFSRVSIVGEGEQEHLGVSEWYLASRESPPHLRGADSGTSAARRRLSARVSLCARDCPWATSSPSSRSRARTRSSTR